MKIRNRCMFFNLSKPILFICVTIYLILLLKQKGIEPGKVSKDVHVVWKDLDKNTINLDLEEPEMRMTKNSTKFEWAYGPDKYNVSETCRKKVYNNVFLPKASIILTFHKEEAIEDIIHTIHSIFKNSPADVLREVVLVNDCSRRDEHIIVLKNYVFSIFSKKIHWVNSETCLGLIQARSLGIKKSSAPVIVVLDAHMEVRENWLQPLLYEISLDKRIMANIYLDFMTQKEDGTWIYTFGSSSIIMAWNWYLFIFRPWEQDSFDEQTRLETDPTLPILSPTSMGHFAMHRDFFQEIGGFDEGMIFWGGENIELSIKTYLWGGRVSYIPCSHVAHLEKASIRDYRNKPGMFKQTLANYKRIADVWLDDYKDVFYKYNMGKFDTIDAGNLTNKLELKKKCPHNFEHYLKIFYPQLGNAFGDNVVAKDGVRSKAYPDSRICIGYYKTVVQPSNKMHRIKENIYLTTEGHLRMELASIDIEEYKGQIKVKDHSYFMERSTRTKWLHRKNGLLKAHGANLCLTVEETTKSEKNLIVETCNSSDPHQLWSFGTYTDLYYNINNQQRSQSDIYLKDLQDFIL